MNDRPAQQGLRSPAAEAGAGRFGRRIAVVFGLLALGVAGLSFEAHVYDQQVTQVLAHCHHVAGVPALASVASAAALLLTLAGAAVAVWALVRSPRDGSAGVGLGTALLALLLLVAVVLLLVDVLAVHQDFMPGNLAPYACD
ncbi:hypothetical protein [Kitasatospora sp. GAS204B]|uniref:hypothetical protein n=1 Tax=unclassified Kitasatospora TaxID=2633591 RepID=UPI00247692B9|nr:hypothetical protein [Kitasatospora sp. GAS204B]MDH6115957.1 hypothetical protein [Kitasatospora sp. GAS204B]